MKKFLIMVFVAVLVLSMGLAMVACGKEDTKDGASDGSAGLQNNMSNAIDGASNGSAGLRYKLLSNDTYGVVGYVGSDKAVTIPSTYNGKAVTAILDEAFEEAEITSIVIPDSIVLIEGDAFEDCVYLRSVTLPNALTVLNYDVFDGCTALTKVTIPTSVVCIYDAFTYCPRLSVIEYNGTKAQWEAIVKPADWDSEICNIYTVKCSDGSIEVENPEHFTDK